MAVDMNLLLRGYFLKAHSFKQTQHRVRRLPNKEMLDKIQAINIETPLIWHGNIARVISVVQLWEFHNTQLNNFFVH